MNPIRITTRRLHSTEPIHAHPEHIHRLASHRDASVIEVVLHLEQYEEVGDEWCFDLDLQTMGLANIGKWDVSDRLPLRYQYSTFEYLAQSIGEATRSWIVYQLSMAFSTRRLE